MKSAEVKRSVADALIPFADDVFSPNAPRGDPTGWGLSRPEVDASIRKMREEFIANHADFIRRFGYEWIEDETVMPLSEWLLQIHTLRILTEISPDHPHYSRCGGIVVLKVNSGRSRIMVVPVNGLQLILIPTGYVLLLKEMLRVWFWGQHLGGITGPINLAPCSEDRWRAFLRGLSEPSHLLHVHCVQLLRMGVIAARNEPWPRIELMRHGFPGTAYGDYFAAEFSYLCQGADAYVVCHELGHVLAGDTAGGPRDLKQEMAADQAAASLAIIYGAVNRLGALPWAGAAVYFTMEIHRLLMERLTAVSEGGEISSHSVQAMEEVQMRRVLMPIYFKKYHAPAVSLHVFHLVARAMVGVYDCTRYSMLVGTESVNGISRLDFVLSKQASASVPLPPDV